MMKDYSTGYIFLTILENLLFLCMVAVSITGYLNQIQSSSDDCWSKWKLKTVNKQLLFFDIKFNCLILKLLHLSSSKIYWHRYSGISGTIVLALTGHMMWSCRLRLTWMYSPSKPVYRSFHFRNVLKNNSMYTIVWSLYLSISFWWKLDIYKYFNFEYNDPTENFYLSKC